MSEHGIVGFLVRWKVPPKKKKKKGMTAEREGGSWKENE